ncbi:MAG: RNA polymerase sigma factor [Planctomycetota bacterium]|jgi:DNA-directed RNA polymerase specialized sigma24 family protein
MNAKKANLRVVIEHLVDGMNESSEQGWVERAKQGDAAAIAELYRRYWRAARATAYGVTADLDLAEDAACEAFYAAIESLTDLKRLRDVAEQIMKGTRLMDLQRKQILQQLRGATEEGIIS